MSQTPNSDHPHVRGEKTPPDERRAQIPGSSPRAWGKVQQTRNIIDSQRIIPTCVGKRPFNFRITKPWTDHPHVRGEKEDISHAVEGFNGSSPRAWGKARAVCRARRAMRIIPTCVGKSLAAFAGRKAVSDHPHVRGEKTAICGNNRRLPGSSPHAWGKGFGVSVMLVFIRIIPTCVGKSIP